jgi:GNAT superfamily N-acetyltransferase
MRFAHLPDMKNDHRRKLSRDNCKAASVEVIDGRLTTFGARMGLRALIFLLIAATLSFGSSAQAKTAAACSAVFSDKSGAYIDLETANLTGELRASVLAARDKVEGSIGWLPVIRRLRLTGISDIKFFEPGVATKKKNAIAYTSYSLSGTKLNMSMTFVKPSYRNKGLSELLIAEILAANPEVDRIHIESLVDTNSELFERAYKKMGLKDSIRETYAYRRYARFGFSKIKDAEYKERKLYPMSANGKQYNMILEEGGVSFTLKRPKKN